MREAERIADQLRRAYQGEAWHGPSLLEVLEGVTPASAAAHPIPGAHSIWEIVSHVVAGREIVRRRLEGDAELARRTTEDDWWPDFTDTSPQAWDALLASLETNNAALVSVISKLDDARLDEPILENMSTVYVTLHGLVQHDLYHAGQIALLKKA